MLPGISGLASPGDPGEGGSVVDGRSFSSFSWLNELSQSYALRSPCAPELWPGFRKALVSLCVPGTPPAVCNAEMHF